MGIETKFEQAVTKWKAHCESVAHSSFAQDYLRCDAYREIVAMGSQVLPLIRGKYAGADEDAFFAILGWSSAIREITGNKLQIPEEIKGKVDAVRDYTVRWLDENIHKYI